MTPKGEEETGEFTGITAEPLIAILDMMLSGENGEIALNKDIFRENHWRIPQMGVHNMIRVSKRPSRAPDLPIEPPLGLKSCSPMEPMKPPVKPESKAE